MSILARFGLLPLFATAAVLCMTGCPKSQDQAGANANQASAQDQAADPAAANLAPVDSNTSTPAANNASSTSPAQTTYTGQQAAPPASTGGNYNQGSDQGSDDPGYGVQPVAYAPQPPPPLPDYDQPPDPGDGYLWTPGYWGYSPAGYYWVPGGWVQASTVGIGGRTSAFTAASTTASATSASATRAVTGEAAISITTAPTTM